MRLKPGRPDIDSYADRFAVPPATPESPLTVTFLGVATLLVSDGESSDPFGSLESFGGFGSSAGSSGSGGRTVVRGSR